MATNSPDGLAKMIAKAPVHAYRWTLKPLMGWECRHLPTCSEYARRALVDHGLLRGLALAARRLARCHPFHPGGWDPPPTRRRAT